MRNPARIFADQETWMQLFFYNETIDPINTIKKTKTKQVIFEGFRFIEPIESSRSNQNLSDKLDFEGKQFMVYFDAIDGDKNFFEDESRELFIRLNKDSMYSLTQNQNWNITLKKAKTTMVSGIHQNMVGMIEIVFTLITV